jgi:hypothetical protein
MDRNLAINWPRRGCPVQGMSLSLFRQCDARDYIQREISDIQLKTERLGSQMGVVAGRTKTSTICGLCISKEVACSGVISSERADPI